MLILEGSVPEFCFMGALVGNDVNVVGCCDGWALGCVLGVTTGCVDGVLWGCAEGVPDGCPDGCVDGQQAELPLGLNVGGKDGLLKLCEDGNCVGGTLELLLCWALGLRERWWSDGWPLG
jgi:hypothetical protein